MKYAKFFVIYFALPFLGAYFGSVLGSWIFRPAPAVPNWGPNKLKEETVFQKTSGPNECPNGQTLRVEVENRWGWGPDPVKYRTYCK